MAQRSRVFLVQEPLRMEDGVPTPRINYRTLQPFGELRFLFTWGEIQDEDSLNDTAALLIKLRNSLHDFNDADYLVPIGNPALIAMAAMVAADLNDGRVVMLDWMRLPKQYRTVNIDLATLDE